MFDYRIQLLLKRLGLLLAVYMVLRLLFLAFNYETFEAAENTELLLAVLHGLRFDAAVILTLNLPFIALSLFPRRLQRKALFQKVLLWLYLLVNLPFIFLNLIDIEFFKFIGRRSTNEIFTITGDIQEQAGQLVLNYWYFVLAGAFFAFLLYRLYPNYNVARQHFSLRGFSISFVLLIAVTVLLIRGGLQLKPLRPSHAFIHTPPILGNLALNSSFTFFNSLSAKGLDRKNYFSSWPVVIEKLDYNPYRFTTPDGQPVKDNVVILIMESFSSEYTGIENNGEGYTPFFDSLATQGLFFREHYANGRKSIEALPSIFAALPSLMDDPFITSPYISSRLYGVGTILEKNGYHTSFFHGAKNGTMGFDTYTRAAGFQKYYGLNEYPESRKKKDFDGKWGIFDGPYLQYTAQVLNRQPQPFLSAIFTLSSHQPYSIPEEHKGRFPKGTLEIHESIGYADFALKLFFETASRQPWYQNTLFIILADHTQKIYRKDYKSNLGLYKTPLLLFHPGKKLTGNTLKITQQTDIFPTIVDYLNISTDKVLPFGRSVLDTTDQGRAFIYTGGYNILLHQDYILQLTPDQKLQLFLYRARGEKFLEAHNPAKKAEYGEELKALLQYYTNGLIENNLYYWLDEDQKP